MNTSTPSLADRLFDKTEFKRLLAIFAPLYVANLIQTCMSLIDTLVAGRAGEIDLAGVAMGTAICWPILIALGHIVAIVAPMIARLRGERKEQRIGHLLNNAKWLALGLMLIAAAALYGASHVFASIAKDAQSAVIAQNYVFFMILGVPAVMMMRVIQGNFEGYAQTRPAMAVAICGMMLNYPLNLLFVFGWGPIPALGGAGCGLATALLNWFMMLGMLTIMLRVRQHRLNAHTMLHWRAPDGAQIKRILKLGFPMGVATLCEVSFFCVVTLIIAPLGTLAVSAQQVALNISGVLFMMPLSFGIAGSIRASFHIGCKNVAGFQSHFSTLFITAMTGVLISMTVIFLVRYPVLGLFTDSQDIINLAQMLVILCALYQIPDAIQALMAGLLRGCHDTTIITWVNLGSYWLIGFPLSYALVRTDWIVPAMGPAGAWVSFIISLTITSILLSHRFFGTRKKIFPELARR